ncbi:MAG TPA: glycosyltransferase [Bryobacteraceae bacterium]|nr:glycosyltransferase [Bryobacteraceae bacterium]
MGSDFYWYAGEVSLDSQGKVQGKPIEFGATNLTPADPLLQAQFGMVGALIIEPEGATWGDLSPMEQLSIASFLAQGHEYHLYSYQEVGNLPAGAVLKDAAEILPKTDIFQYEKNRSYAGFSNFFRYRLLLRKGGWWADTDVVCLKQFTFETPYVFATERVEGIAVAATAVIKAPAGSEIMAYAWHGCKACQNPAAAFWGQLGPKLMARAIKQFELGSYLQPAEVFCPLGYDEWEMQLAPDSPSFGEQTHAVHLWNEMWRRGGRDKRIVHGPGCLYERLKQAYGFASVIAS